jgi:hypothetical protein
VSSGDRDEDGDGDGDGDSVDMDGMWDGDVVVDIKGTRSPTCNNQWFYGFIHTQSVRLATDVHGARFEESKYVLVHFTKARAPNAADDTHVRIGDTTIKPAEEAKYLGVVFDRNSHSDSTSNVRQRREHSSHLQFRKLQMHTGPCIPANQDGIHLCRSPTNGLRRYSVVQTLPRSYPPQPTTIGSKARFSTMGRNEGDIEDLLHYCHHCSSD